MKLILITAMNQDNIIGVDNALPWYHSEDLKHFKKLTDGFPLIMGRNTWESIPESIKPFKNRLSVVLSGSMDNHDTSGVVVAKTPSEALELASKWNWCIPGEDKVFVIGGATAYSVFLPHVDEMFITHIEHPIDITQYTSVTYFPVVDMDDWLITTYKQFSDGSKVLHYVRKKK